MGLMKRILMEEQERGYSHSDKYVCTSCFGDLYIQKYIRNNGYLGHCSFCKKDSRKTLKLEKLMPVIMEGIKQEYLLANGNDHWDTEEQSYDGSVIDHDDFIEALNEYLMCKNQEVLEELSKIIAPEFHVPADEFITRQEEHDMEEWVKYKKLVKNSIFSPEQIVTLCKKDDAPKDLKEIRHCLEKVLYYVKEMNMTSIIRPNTKIFRCVNHLDYNKTPGGFSYIPATSIGTAPADHSNHGRMNVCGDAMFYGAFCKELAMIEVGKNEDKGKENFPATIGCFHTNKRFKILDISDVSDKKCPSLFDIPHKNERSIWFFLKKFIEEISAYSNGGDDYKPTQVFAKYIQEGWKFNGIQYRSSRANKKIINKKCIVLFVLNRDCLDMTDKVNKKRAQLIMEDNPEQCIFVDEQIQL